MTAHTLTETRRDELTRTYVLTAGETDAQSRMPMWLIVERAIETATEHADSLGIGYSKLKEHGIGWVLTRITVTMERYPVINDTYSVTTWIESYNRLYSDRCFVITDADGHAIGHARSQWVAIDMYRRTAADLTELERESFPISERQCPISKQRKLGALPTEQVRQVDYTFKFSDLDFNRHVNTVQYVRRLLDQWSLSFYDMHRISTFAIAFHHECYFGETVTIRVHDIDELHAHCEIVRDGRRAIAAAFEFESD